jgi:hypothetical protein
MTLAQKIKQVDDSLPSNTLSALLVTAGVAIILIGLFVPSNIIKATALAYVVLP